MLAVKDNMIIIGWNLLRTYEVAKVFKICVLTAHTKALKLHLFCFGLHMYIQLLAVVHSYTHVCDNR